MERPLYAPTECPKAWGCSRQERQGLSGWPDICPAQRHPVTVVPEQPVRATPYKAVRWQHPAGAQLRTACGGCTARLLFVASQAPGTDQLAVHVQA